MNKKTDVVVLGCNFVGLTVSRFLHREAGDKIQITFIDRKNYINFIPNIPIELFKGHNPADNLEFGFKMFLHKDRSHFILCIYRRQWYL